MSNIVNLDEVRNPTILSCPYFLHHTSKDGTVHKIELTGEEIVSTICPKCSRGHSMTFEDFLEIMQGGCLYGTMVYCAACAKRRAKI